MNTIQKKLVVAGVLLTGAVGYLATAGVKSGWVYFVEVDKVATDAQYRTQRVRMQGKVAEAGLEVSPGSLSARFNLLGQTKQIPVAYHGTIPDLFRANHEVVVEGRFDDAGVFRADVLMTKCASKYEAGSPHAKTAGNEAESPPQKAENES